MADIKEKVRQFLRGDIPTSEFEQWVYDTPELETLLGFDLFLEVISLDYQNWYAVESMKGRLIAWFNERYPNSIPEIDEDRERGTIRINGREIAGFVLGLKCIKCNSFFVHHDIYDSNFCPLCNLWTTVHPVCNDRACPFCSLKRPQRPLTRPND